MTRFVAYFLYIFSRQKLQLSTYAIVLLVTLLISPGIRSYAQSDIPNDKIRIFLEVSETGGKEIDAIVKGDEILLPVNQVFDFFNIRINPSTAFETISGRILDQESSYSINWSKNEIQYGARLFKLKEDDLIRTDSDLYLKAKYFKKIFGLKCNYSIKNQSVKVEPELVIPVVRELRQGELRVNFNRLTGQDESDVEVGRDYPLFKFGMADWSVSSRQEINGPAEAKVNLSLGSVIAGGEATAAINYNSSDPFREKDQYYLWRFVDNYNSAFSQISVGKINLLSTSTINDPVLGVQLTNTPTTLRKSSGTYTYSDITEPNWIVELYVNNVLVEYAMADASGFFTFKIPLVYGNSPLRLKFYGPWGEERSMEQQISLPFSFVPEKTLEYDLSAGIVEDSLRSRILRMNANYGVSQNVTISAGYEFFSTVAASPMMPYLKGSFKLATNLILTSELTYKVRSKSTLTYRLPSNIQFGLNYTRYNKEQEAIYHNYREERNVSVFMPLRFKKFYVNNRMTVNQIVMETSNSTAAEWVLSGSLFGLNTNITTSGLFITETDPYIYSKLALSYRFASGLRITPMAQYGYSDKKLLSLKIGMEKEVFKHAYLNLSFGQDFKDNMLNAELGFRYNFNFAQTGLAGIRSGNRTSLVQYARGSIISDHKTNYFKADHRSNVGEGGITIIPFFDKNANGKRDPGENKVFGLDLFSSAGRIEQNTEDSTIRILSLEAYTKCFLEFDDRRIDNPPLKLTNSTYSVHIDPNMLKEIEVPLIISGKASGIIRVNWDGKIRELDGIVSNLYNEDHKQVGRVFSGRDGSYKFEGLSLGKYAVKIDSIQLQRIGMTSTPDSVSFEISADSGGISVSGLDFMLELAPEPQEEEPEVVQEEVADSIQDITDEPVVQITKKDSTYIKIHELVQEVATATTDSYAIQLGAFGKKSNAIAYKERLEEKLDRKIEIVVENGLYKVRILDFESREEVDEFTPELGEIGIKEMWVINLKGVQKQMLLMTVRDTITEVIEIRTEIPGTKDQSTLNIQLGAFRDSSRAEILRSKLDKAINRPVIIEKESGYYKVRLTGFDMPEQREAFVPQLQELGIRDIWVVPYDTARYKIGEKVPVDTPAIVEKDLQIVIDNLIIEEELPVDVVVEEEIVEEEIPVEEIVEEVIPVEVVVEEEITEEELPVEEKVEEEIPVDVVVEEEIVEEELPVDVVVEEEIVEEEIPVEEIVEELDEEVVEEMIEEEPVKEEVQREIPVIEQPRFSIQAGVFPDLSEAKRAQRKIQNKLGLESVLVQEIDYTRVLIPGFYTRQETFRYYPELAGLGYDNVQVIEKRK